MKFAPVVVVESGGVPFTQVAEGKNAPTFTVVESGAFAITLTDRGPPIALFNPDGTRYDGGAIVPPYPAPDGYEWAFVVNDGNPVTYNGDRVIALKEAA